MKMASIDIDIAYIEKLAELLERTGLSEIEIGQGETRVRVARHLQARVEYAAPPPPPPPPPAAVEAPPPAAEPEPSNPGAVTAPMVGTVYLAPEPGADPFVRVGDQVQEGQTLLIIEAMKVMNTIRAPRAGVVTRILVENAQPVEFGEPLLVIE